MVTDPAKGHLYTFYIRKEVRDVIRDAGGYEDWLEEHGAADDAPSEEITIISPAALLPRLQEAFDLTDRTTSQVLCREYMMFRYKLLLIHSRRFMCIRDPCLHVLWNQI